MPSIFLGLVVFLVWYQMTVHATPQNPDPSEFIDFNLNDPSDNVFLGSDDFNSDLADLNVDPANHDTADLSIQSNSPLADTDLWDLASLPDSCKTDDSSTMNGVLRSRDGSSCALPEGRIDLPLGLFQNPEGYLDEKLSLPPVGPGDQQDQGSAKDGDLGFGAFMQNRPSSYTPMEPDSQTCDPRIFGGCTVPLCSNPVTGALESVPGRLYRYTLFNVFPCK